MALRLDQLEKVVEILGLNSDEAFLQHVQAGYANAKTQAETGHAGYGVPGSTDDRFFVTDAHIAEMQKQGITWVEFCKAIGRDADAASYLLKMGASEEGLPTRWIGEPIGWIKYREENKPLGRALGNQ